MTLLKTLADRYVEDGDCLRWTAGCINGRHPSIARGKLVRRLLWEERHGPIPAGMVVRCTCETPKCINIAHCELTTFQKIAKQLGAQGAMSGPARAAKIAASHRARHPLTRLTQDQAREIRDSEEAGTVLAARYGVSESTVSRIKLGRVRKEFGGNVWRGLGA